MPNKPEQLIYAKLKRELVAILPKGSFMLQRIETSTGSGIPDVYFSVRLRSQDLTEANSIDLNKERGSFSCWLETKTLDYKVSDEQLNWAHLHQLAGGKTWVVTNTCQSSSHAIIKGLVMLDFDDRMRNYSTLGSYIRNINPELSNCVDWITHLRSETFR